ncbi:MAG: FIG007959: peptidase, M16 family, partial [uncultured Solirubrobacterales bacterium]
MAQRTRALPGTGTGGAPETVRRTVLPGGLRVVSESMPGVRSVAFGIWVGVGSR